MRSNTEVVLARRGRKLSCEIHRQQVRLIQQLESDDRRSQSSGLTERLAE